MMKDLYIATFIFLFIIAFLCGCASMKTLDIQANYFVNSWKGKTMEEFVRVNPNLNPFQTINLGGGKSRHVYAWREDITTQSVVAGMIAGKNQDLYRIVYLFVDSQGVIYDATWEKTYITR